MPPDGHLDSMIQDTPVSKNKTFLSNQLEKSQPALEKNNKPVQQPLVSTTRFWLQISLWDILMG